MGHRLSALFAAALAYATPAIAASHGEPTTRPVVAAAPLPHVGSRHHLTPRYSIRTSVLVRSVAQASVPPAVIPGPLSYRSMTVERTAEGVTIVRGF
jgi:hypothetical protein